MRDFNFTDLLRSIFIASFLGMLLSHNLTFAMTDSNLRDGSLMIQSRPLITVEALNTIAIDDTISIVGTGSSMTGVSMVTTAGEGGFDKPWAAGPASASMTVVVPTIEEGEDG